MGPQPVACQDRWPSGSGPRIVGDLRPASAEAKNGSNTNAHRSQAPGCHGWEEEKREGLVLVSEVNWTRVGRCLGATAPLRGAGGGSRKGRDEGTKVPER